MSEGFIRNAEKLVADAKATQAKWSLPWATEGKFAQSAELYKDAAAQFKMGKDYKKAGDCLAAQGDLFETKLSDPLNAGEAYLDAARSYRQSEDIDLAMKYFAIVVEKYTSKSRFLPAAKIYKEMAEIETDNLSFDKAAIAWQNAADCYTAGTSPVHANSCLVKVADISAKELKDYKKAVNLYEEISKNCSAGSEWSVSNHLFKSTLCRWVMDLKEGDIQVTEDAYERYNDQYPKFEDSKESKLLKQLIECYKGNESDKFIEYTHIYDTRYGKLDAFIISMVNVIHKALKHGVDANLNDIEGDEREHDDEDEYR